jgi:hypothetical protein
MWHFGDREVKPFVTVRVSNGTRYGIVSQDLLGDNYDLFLISSKSPNDRGSWTRPILIPNRIYRGFHDAKLTEGESGQLVFTFVQGTSGPRDLMEGQLAPPEKAPVLGMIRVLFGRNCRGSAGPTVWLSPFSGRHLICGELHFPANQLRGIN